MIGWVHAAGALLIGGCVTITTVCRGLGTHAKALPGTHMEMAHDVATAKYTHKRGAPTTLTRYVWA